MNFFVVVLVALLLLNLFSLPIASAIPNAGQNVSAIISGLVQGLKNITSSLANAAAGNNAALATPNAVAATPPVTITDSAGPLLPLTVAPGATITVSNQGSSQHTVTVTDVNGTSFGSVVIPGSIPGGPVQSRVLTAPTSRGMYYYSVNTSPASTGTLTVS
ncbi:MAG: cupredoxin domain-containing protein [Pseudonocardiaceae bacterium]